MPMFRIFQSSRYKYLMEGLLSPFATSLAAIEMQGAVNAASNKSPGEKSLGRGGPSPSHADPVAPITTIPSERLVHAGYVLRTVLITRYPHMIRDRKCQLRTYRRCMVGTEMVDWLLQFNTAVHNRLQAVGMWQALVEEGVVVHVNHEHQFKERELYYRFTEDDQGVGSTPSQLERRECDEALQDVLSLLAQIGPDAMFRMLLRKPTTERGAEDLKIIYEELLHIKALSHLSTMVKRELSAVLMFESHEKAGTVLFHQGEEGKSWYIILKGSVNVVIYGKGVVCTLHEGDDFGKLALVNDAPRAATIVLREDNCHFLRVDKDDFNRILRDVEANTVRLKEHGQDVLILEKIPVGLHANRGINMQYKYSVMAGTPEKILEHLLETSIGSNCDTSDCFLEDFILTHMVFMPSNHLCPTLMAQYHMKAATQGSVTQASGDHAVIKKRQVIQFVLEWCSLVTDAFWEDRTIQAFLEELHGAVVDDCQRGRPLKEELQQLEAMMDHKQRTTGIVHGQSKRRPTRRLSRGELLQPDQDRTRKPIRATDESIFKVYCADHTYTTLKLRMDATVRQIIEHASDKLCLGNNLILCEVKSSGEVSIFENDDLCVATGLSLNGRLFVSPREHIDALTPLPEQDGPSGGTGSTLEQMSAKELAYHMTVYDWQLFACIHEYELIYHVVGRSKLKQITANLDLMLFRFNEVQYWVVTEICLTQNINKRAQLLRKLIKLAAYCKEYRNLNSFFAIVMGLSNTAVIRLSQTWEKVPGKFRRMFSEFEVIMDPTRNHRAYRLFVNKVHAPSIPFMPLLMKDMTFTHEGNKTYFDGLVNFEKMHMLAHTLRTVRYCRSKAFDIEAPASIKSTHDIKAYVKHFNVIDNQKLLNQLSTSLEPKHT